MLSKKILILIALLLLRSILGYGQNIKYNSENVNTNDNHIEEVSIYEIGSNIKICETNFRNLFNNWHTNYITNAHEYNLITFSYVETITDSMRFNYYCNYFSSAKPIYSSIGSSLESNNSSLGNFKALYVYPSLRYRTFYDTLNLQKKMRLILSDIFLQKVDNLLSMSFNVDTLNLIYYSKENIRRDTTTEYESSFKVFRVEEDHTFLSLASTDSLSQDYIDVFIHQTRRIDELSLVKARALILEYLMIERVNNQLFFINKISIGDKVYDIQFEYRGTLYHNIVVCDYKSNKVIVDFFFKHIKLKKEQ